MTDRSQAGGVPELVEMLRAAEVDVSEERLLDLLWMARILPEGAPREPWRPPVRNEPEPRPDPGPPPPPADEPRPTVREELIEVIVRREEYESGEVYDEGAERGGGEIRVTRQRVAGVPALPQARWLGRSLRPLGRTRLRGDGVVDEAATVDRIADSGLVLPVIRPGREKLFDAVVVLDDRASMIVWRQTAIELTRLLARLGIFRDASLLRLGATQPTEELTLRDWKGGDWRGWEWDDSAGQTTPVDGTGTPPGRKIESLLDPEGHRVVFLLSDGVAEVWRDGRMHRVLARWGRSMPVVLVQVLGEERWHRTTHGEPRARVTAPEPGVPNRRLTFSNLEVASGAMAVPIIMPYPRSMERWAQMLMNGEGEARALVVDEASGEAARPAKVDGNRPLPPIEKRFSWMSGTAQKLACFLAAVPLDPGVMRLVQQVMLPQSRIEHLAEVVLSGLIRRPQPNRDLFDFVDELETRRWLVDQLRYGELLTVIERVSEYVSERLGRRLDLVALLRDPAGDLSVPEEALPFARIAQQALEVHGILPRRATGRVIEVRTLGRVQLHPFTFDTVTLDERGQEIRRTPGQGWQFVEPLAEGVPLEMVRIDGGTFSMGSPLSEKGRSDNEGPLRKVTLPSFYLGKYAVTQAQWRVVAGWEKVEIELPLDPSRFPKNKYRRVGDDDRRPVDRVNWFQAREFCARLTRRTDRAYRLPSEAEWEYACRAGTTTPFAFGPTVTPDIVNYNGNYPYGRAPKGVYREQTIPVGSLGIANPWGLYDMHGNVWEWCGDHAGSYEDAPHDGQPLIFADGAEGERRNRRLRGGSWHYYSNFCRAARRSHNGPGLNARSNGLRVVVGAGTALAL